MQHSSCGGHAFSSPAYLSVLTYGVQLLSASQTSESLRSRLNRFSALWFSSLRVPDKVYFLKFAVHASIVGHRW